MSGRAGMGPDEGIEEVEGLDGAAGRPQGEAAGDSEAGEVTDSEAGEVTEDELVAEEVERLAARAPRGPRGPRRPGPFRRLYRG